MSHVESMKLSLVSLAFSVCVCLFLTKAQFLMCPCSLAHNLSCVFFDPLCLDREKKLVT